MLFEFGFWHHRGSTWNVYKHELIITLADVDVIFATLTVISGPSRPQTYSTIWPTCLRREHGIILPSLCVITGWSLLWDKPQNWMVQCAHSVHKCGAHILINLCSSTFQLSYVITLPNDRHSRGIQTNKTLINKCILWSDPRVSDLFIIMR